MIFKRELYRIAKENKEKFAVSSHGVSLTYNDLLNKAKSIIPAIKEEKRVGLFFEKSTEYIQALFAVTLSDSAFVPLDISSPEERLQFMLKDASIQTIITSKKHSNEIKKIPSNIKILFIEDFKNKNETLTLRETKDESAYVIYTSGSTGLPKGVDVSFNGLDNVIFQQINLCEMKNNNFYLYLAMSFDASLSDIYCCLLSGSHIFIRDCLKRDAIGLIEFFNKNEITHSDLPPSLLKLLKPSDFKTLKNIIIGGEVADYQSVQSFAKKMKVINVYGPTEATICTSMIVCDENWNKPLIGLPLYGVDYKIIDKDNNEIKDKNEIGELIIGGCQLAKGYINNEKMNKERFFCFNGKRFYKSGDLVSLNNDGLIEFKGRVDRQIKYHGQLICLEEIETAINSVEEIKSVSVIFKNKKLYAYYEGNINSEILRDRLLSKLPIYMIPSFLINKLIPKTVTGKNDGKLLKLQDSKNDEVIIISNLFKKVLKINNDEIIDSNLSFIKDLNADSLDFIDLHISLQRMGIFIDYDELINNDSINGILNNKNKKQIIDTNYLVKEYNKLEKIEIKQQKEKTNEKVLLTGATGFLGSSILEKLLKEDKQIYCLLRGDSKIDKIKKIFVDQGLKWNKNYENKIIVIKGDISEEDLGLGEQYLDLTNEITTVYHCAAEVNNIKTFNQMFKSNVLSTINIAKFVFQGCKKILHYASTLSVYVSSNKTNNTICYENYLENDGHILYSGYAQTKWLSEYYLNQLQKESNNIFVYRFGLLTPDSNKNIKQKNSFLANCFKEFKEINELPIDNIGLSMDITPIDIASKAMYQISKNENANIYHITLNKKLSLNEIKSLLLIKNEIDTKKWFEKYGDKRCSQYLTDLDTRTEKQHNMNLFETTRINYFDVTNAQKYLKATLTNDYLKNL